jgi:hypothetical protein
MSRCHVFRWSRARNCAPAPTSTHVLFLKLAGREILATDGRLENQTLTAGCGWREKPFHELPTVGRALLLHHRPRESCGTTYTFCSLVSAMEDFRDFVAHFRRKNKFVGSEIWFAFGGENLEEKNCTNFFLGFLILGFGDAFGLSLPAGLAHVFCLSVLVCELP